MKFERKTLMAFLDSEIRRLDRQHEEDVRDYEDRRGESSVAYFDRYGDLWREFAETINRRLNDALPIDIDDVPPGLREHGSYLKFFDPYRDYTAAPGGRAYTYIRKPDRPDTAELSAFLIFLQMTTDEEITSAALERAGFRRLHALFHRAARNQAAAKDSDGSA